MKSKIYKFPNGGVVLYEKCKVNKATDFEFGLLQGSCVDEFSGKTHFLEHMMFKSTKNKSLEELNNTIKEKLFGINGYTSMSNIAVTIYQSNKKLEETFDIVSDMMINSKLEETEFESEKKVILQEISRNDDNYPQLLWHNLYTSVYNYPQSYSNPLGDIKKVQNLKVNELQDFAKTIIFKNNFYMSVSGSAPFNKVKKLFKKYFLDKLEEKPEYKRVDSYAFEINSKSKLIVTEKDINKVYVDLAVPSFSISCEDESYALNYIYGYINQFKGVMFNELREKNSLVYQVHSFNYEHRRDGLFIINFETTKDKLNDCILAIGRVFEKIRKEGIPQKDIDVMKNNIKLSADKFVPTPYKSTRNLVRDYYKYGFILSKSKGHRIVLKMKKEVIDNKLRFICNPTKVWVSVLGNATRKDIFTIDKVLKILNGQVVVSNVGTNNNASNKAKKVSTKKESTKINVENKNVTYIIKAKPKTVKNKTVI